MAVTAKPHARPSILTWSFSVLSILLAFVLFVVTYEGEYRWMGHAVVGLAGLVLIIIVIMHGATLTGRLKRDSANAYGIHKKVSSLFASFMLATFFFGLWVVYSHGEELLGSIHGWLGLAIVILAFIQVLPCFFVKHRAKVKRLHMVAGFTVAFLVVVQAAWGLEVAVVGEVKDLVIFHSIFGALAAFALTWIIIEMRHLTAKGLARAKMAAFAAAFFNIVGCWFAGIYYYLTVYSSQLKPIIVSSEPWVHRIILETKEHVFLFLPVLTLTLMLMLVWLSKDQTLFVDQKARRAIIALAVLALVLILVTFVFGAVISNAISIGGGE